MSTPDSSDAPNAWLTFQWGCGCISGASAFYHCKANGCGGRETHEHRLIIEDFCIRCAPMPPMITTNAPKLPRKRRP